MKYYNENIKCKKCGNNSISTKYNQEKSITGILMDDIFRKCERCGYFWFESPLDRKEEEL